MAIDARNRNKMQLLPRTIKSFYVRSRRVNFLFIAGHKSNDKSTYSNNFFPDNRSNNDENNFSLSAPCQNQNRRAAELRSLSTADRPFTKRPRISVFHLRFTTRKTLQSTCRLDTGTGDLFFSSSSFPFHGARLVANRVDTAVACHDALDALYALVTAN